MTVLSKMGWTIAEWFAGDGNYVPGRQLVTAQCFTNALRVERTDWGEVQYQVQAALTELNTPTHNQHYKVR